MGLRNLGCAGQALVGIVFALACLGVLSVLGERWEALHVRSPATAQAASQPIGTTGQRLVIDGTTPASTPTGAAAQQIADALVAPPDPVLPLSPPASETIWLVVRNTGGIGVYLRRSPQLADRWYPVPEGTRLQVVGDDVEGDGHRWKYVRAPGGHVGWVPAEYVAPAD